MIIDLMLNFWNLRMRPKITIELYYQFIRILFCQHLVFFKIRRYINPRLGIRKPYIFHSSYYRISRDRSAINFTTVHDFTYEKSGGKGIRSRIHMWQQKQAVMKSDYIICISENTKRDLLHYYKGIDSGKIYVVYNGVSDDYCVLSDKMSLNLPFPVYSYCIYVGVRRKYKNYNLAVDAIAKLGYKLILVGSPLSEEESRLLKDKVGAGNYICLSKVSNVRLNELYNGAFALLYLSSYEGFGIPCLEAQKAGCPVVAYNSSSIPEVVCNQDMLVDELNVDSVVKRLRKLEDKNYRLATQTMSVRFAQQFSWDITYKQLTELYDHALKTLK